MILMTLEDKLWQLTVNDIKYYLKLAGIGVKGIKRDNINQLLTFLEDKSWVKKVFDELPDYDKEMMRCYIEQNYHPSHEDIRRIVEKYQPSHINFFSTDIFANDSKANLFFIGGDLLEEIKEELQKLVPPLEMKITKADESEVKYFEITIQDREKRTSDFDGFLKYFNTHKVQATKAKKLLSKKDLLKIKEKLNYSDFLERGDDFSELSTILDTNVSKGIMSLLENAELIKLKNGIFELNQKVVEKYQMYHRVEKVRFLLQNYLDENKTLINECDSIKENNFIFYEKSPKFGKIRKKILEYLKQCPTKTWLVMDDFKKWLRIQEYRFLRDELTSALVKDKYYNDYYEASFEQLETRFLDRMFIEYLATLGIVDVACLIDIDDYDEEFAFVKLFKITELGSILLGLEEEKEEPIEDDIKINEDFTITLKEGMLQHELYFERFLDKNNDQYVLNFEGMAKALEMGLKIKDIASYLMTYCKTVPENVKTQLEKWEKDSKKIKIKTVTILELDKETYQDFMKQTEYQDCIDSLKDHMIILKPSKIEELKKRLIKNQQFVNKE